MSDLIQAIVGGLLIGGIYGLVAMGLSLIFGVMRIINFAHGQFVMVAMFFSYCLVALLKIDPYLAMFIVAPFMFGFGYLFQRLLLNKLLQREQAREPISIMLFTAGLGLILQNVALKIFGSDALSVHTSYSNATLIIKNIIFSETRLLAFIIAIVCSLVLLFVIMHTEIGRKIRATSQNRNVAQLMGINIKPIYCIAFGVGSALVGIAGSLLIPFYYVFPTVGDNFGLRSFIIVVLGGIGSTKGALIAGILVGVIDAVSTQFVSPTYSQLLVFIFFIAILLFKPSGLFGTEKA